jgi:hypothetical protein
MLTDYDKQAEEFLKATGTEFKTEFLRHGKHLIDDKETRDIYRVTLKRGNREYSTEFGQSLADSGFKALDHSGRVLSVTNKHDQSDRSLKNFQSLIVRECGSLSAVKITKPKEPTAYDVLTCLEKYVPGPFPDWCDEFGYSEDSRKTETIYRVVKLEFAGLQRLYTDAEIEQLREIQ